MVKVQLIFETAKFFLFYFRQKIRGKRVVVKNAVLGEFCCIFCNEEMGIKKG